MAVPQQASDTAHTDQFSSPQGLVLAAIASAVGLGNIILFPYRMTQMADKGFLVLYLLSVVLVVLPLLCLELVLGHLYRRAPTRALVELHPRVGRPATLLVYIAAGAVVVNYVYLLSITAKYFVVMLAELPPGVDRTWVQQTWTDYAGTPDWLEFGVYGLLMIVVSSVIVGRGLIRGVEQAARYFVVALAAIFLLLVLDVASLPRFYEAMLSLGAMPRFDAETGQVLLAALAQAFFSLSVGIGIMTTYGAYHRPADRFGYGSRFIKYGIIIALADTAVSILASLVVRTIEPELAVKADYNLFYTNMHFAFSNLPLGEFLGPLFFFLLIMTALTSFVSLLEVFVLRISTRLRSTDPSSVRGRAVTLVASVSFVVFAMIVRRDVRVSGTPLAGYFEWLDAGLVRTLLPLSALASVVTVLCGLQVKRKAIVAAGVRLRIGRRRCRVTRGVLRVLSACLVFWAVCLLLILGVGWFMK